LTSRIFGSITARETTEMKVQKEKFDAVLTKLLKAKPEPRKKIKAQGRKGSKAPILAKP